MSDFALHLTPANIGDADSIFSRMPEDIRKIVRLIDGLSRRLPRASLKALLARGVRRTPYGLVFDNSDPVAAPLL